MDAAIVDLENRLKNAKRFLNTELSGLKTGRDNTRFSRAEVDRHLDTIHETERTGFRQINEMQEIKIERMLTSVESVMSLHKN